LANGERTLLICADDNFEDAQFNQFILLKLIEEK
jgi:hypothetical protein